MGILAHRREERRGLAVQYVQYNIYVLLPYIIYVMQSVVFHNIPQTAKERDKKYSVKSP